MRLIKYLILLILLVIIFTGSAFFYINSPEGDGKKIKFLIKKGETPSQIASRLYENNLTKHHIFFLYLTKYYLSRGKTIHKGLYHLSTNLSSLNILEMFTTKGVAQEPQIHITIKEGHNIFDIAKTLVRKEIIQNEDEFISLVKSPEILKKYNIEGDSLEGYLYPETYSILKTENKTESLKSIIHRMVTLFNKKFPKEDFDRLKDKFNLTKHQVITLASLIEKETGDSKEKNIVSSVYHNRLKRNMKMECDPTVIYALLLEDKYKGNLSRRRGDLDIDSPYNTYRYKGLPPSPIANPSREAIISALNPDDTNYIYFVAQNDKTHLFATTYKEHLQNIKIYRKWWIENQRKKNKADSE